MDKILVIDDSPVQSEFLCSILKGDYELTTCQNAEDGLREAKEGNYSLILLDVVMPGVDGFMMMQELKATELTRHIPVILLTSLADVQYEERGLLLGAVDYVTKPFSPVIIKARVNTHIQLHHYQMQFKKQAMVDELTGVANRRRSASPVGGRRCALSCRSPSVCLTLTSSRCITTPLDTPQGIR